VKEWQYIFKALPFLRVSVLFSIGIIINKVHAIEFDSIAFTHFLSISLLIIYACLSIHQKWKYTWIIPTSIFIYIITLGAINDQQKINSRVKSNNINDLYLLHVKAENKSGKNGKSLIAKVYVRNQLTWKFQGKTYMYVYNKVNKQINEGDLILTRKAISQIYKTHNPGEFDFFSFSESNGMFYNLSFTHEDEFIVIGNQNSKVQMLISRIREKILFKLRFYIKNKDALGIAEAMLIGYKNDLSSSINQIYTDAGVSHVIAISGMHLGLIYMIVDIIFSWFFKKRQLHLISLLITLPALWIFSFITGASASVIRSAIMFSFIIIGNVTTKRSNTLNALFGAAFLMLAVNPDTITDIGFQLSFAAVLSIVLFYQKIRTIIFTKNKILQYGWSFVALSIAAQIITTPLLLIYFQRFSTYSILNNIIVVPISSMVLILEIFLCISPLQIISIKILSPLIEQLILCMNKYSSTMNMVTHSNIEIQAGKEICVILIGLFIICIICFLVKRDIHLLYMSICIVILVFIIRINKWIIYKPVQKLNILNLKDCGAIIHQHGSEADVFIYGNWSNTEQRNKEILHKAFKYLGIKKRALTTLGKNSFIIKQDHHKTGILLNGDNFRTTEINGLMGKNSTWITDGSTKLWKIRRWEKEAQNLHLRFLHTAEKGPIFLDCQDYHTLSRKN
jgi:competence protein ComEC